MLLRCVNTYVFLFQMSFRVLAITLSWMLHTYMFNSRLQIKNVQYQTLDKKMYLERKLRDYPYRLTPSRKSQNTRTLTLSQIGTVKL